MREAVFESEIVVHRNALLMVVLRGYTSRCVVDASLITEYTNTPLRLTRAKWSGESRGSPEKVVRPQVYFEGSDGSFRGTQVG